MYSKIVPLTLFLLLLSAGMFAYSMVYESKSAKANSANVIATSVSLDEPKVLDESSPEVVLDNGMKLSQATGTASVVTVADSDETPMLILEEN